MIDRRWYELVPQVAEASDFHQGMVEGGCHWWDDWHGEAKPEEIEAFLTQDWSYAWVMRRNQEAQLCGLPVCSEAYAAGFVLGWFGAVCGD